MKNSLSAPCQDRCSAVRGACRSTPEGVKLQTVLLYHFDSGCSSIRWLVSELKKCGKLHQVRRFSTVDMGEMTFGDVVVPHGTIIDMLLPFYPHRRQKNVKTPSLGIIRPTSCKKGPHVSPLKWSTRVPAKDVTR